MTLAQGPSLAGTPSGIPKPKSISPTYARRPPCRGSRRQTASPGYCARSRGTRAGRVLLVSSPSPGMGASSVALNLAISASKAGRLVMLVDADPFGARHRAGSSHREPHRACLMSLRGTATLIDGNVDVDARRRLELSDAAGRRAIPPIPSGSGRNPRRRRPRCGLRACRSDRHRRPPCDVVECNPGAGGTRRRDDPRPHRRRRPCNRRDRCRPNSLPWAGAPVVGYVRNLVLLPPLPGPPSTPSVPPCSAPCPSP